MCYRDRDSTFLPLTSGLSPSGGLEPMAETLGQGKAGTWLFVLDRVSFLLGTLCLSFLLLRRPLPPAPPQPPPSTVCRPRNQSTFSLVTSLRTIPTTLQLVSKHLSSLASSSLPTELG